jgi:hypothetical protein
MSPDLLCLLFVYLTVCYVSDIQLVFFLEVLPLFIIHLLCGVSDMPHSGVYALVDGKFGCLTVLSRSHQNFKVTMEGDFID